MDMSNMAEKLVDRMLNPDSAKLIKDLVQIEVEKARASASQDFVDAAQDRHQLVIASASQDVTNWAPEFKALLVQNATQEVERAKPSSRR